MSKWQAFKTKFASWLLSDEACPCCKKKIESLEGMVEDLNQRLKGQITHNNHLAQRLATSQPRSVPMDL